MNRIYKEFYQKKVFTLAEAAKIIKKNQVCRNNINRLNKQGLIKRMKAGLYFIIPLDNPEFYPEPLHIGSKLRPQAVLCANSALKIHGMLNNAEDTIYISSDRPAKVRIGRNTYRIIKGFNFGTDNVPYQTPYGNFELKVTDIERTILDCLRTRSIKAIDLITLITEKKPQISLKKVLNYLEKYNMPILYSKAGLILEACKGHITIDESELEKMRKKLTKKINYFKERGIRLTRPRYHYNKEWNIMIPEALLEKINSLKPVVTP